VIDEVGGRVVREIGRQITRDWERFDRGRTLKRNGKRAVRRITCYAGQGTEEVLEGVVLVNDHEEMLHRSGSDGGALPGAFAGQGDGGSGPGDSPRSDHHDDNDRGRADRSDEPRGPQYGPGWRGPTHGRIRTSVAAHSVPRGIPKGSIAGTG